MFYYASASIWRCQTIPLYDIVIWFLSAHVFNFSLSFVCVIVGECSVITMLIRIHQPCHIFFNYLAMPIVPLIVHLNVLFSLFLSFCMLSCSMLMINLLSCLKSQVCPAIQPSNRLSIEAHTKEY